MFDRYDPRDARDRDGSWDRSRGSRGGTAERDRNEGHDSRDIFVRDLDLPRGQKRELIRERSRVYEINNAESRMLATVGAFRVVSESDLGMVARDVGESADVEDRDAERHGRRVTLRESPAIRRARRTSTTSWPI